MKSLKSLAPLISLALSLQQLPSAKAQGFSLSADSDGVSKLQNISAGAESGHFDPDLTLTNTQSCGWRANIENTNSGVIFQIRRGAISGPENIQSSITISAEDGASQAVFVPAANYTSGVPLTNISSTYETLGWVRTNGEARFRLKVFVSSKSKNGSGNVSGTLSIIGALAP